MTFNQNANVGGNTARRRGGGLAVGGGVAGLGAVAVLLLNLFTGGDFSSLLGGPGGSGLTANGGTSSGSELQNCETGADANRDDDCRLAATTPNLNKFWAARVDGYRPPQLIIVEGSTTTQCGTASNATGPFYCPPEETVYVDPTFFALLSERFDATAGPLAQMYVLAHEYGHHIQQITGITRQHPNNGTGPDSNGVRIELQADCFAGAWVADAGKQTDSNDVAYLQQPTPTQIQDALNAAASVGDDHIQEASGARVNPESFTHGSSQQRTRWFDTGYEGGVGACDTFAASGGQL